MQVLRHGETVGGARYWGGIDVALSPTGWQQMRAAVAGGSWERIVSSPLRRCAAFAATLAQELGVSCRYDADLREMSFGAWEGRSAEELMQTDAEALRRFWADPSVHAPPGGEPLGQLAARVMAACQRVVNTAQGERTLVVTHSGPIRLLRAAQTGTPLSRLLSIEVPYAALIEVASAPDGSIRRDPHTTPAAPPESG